MAFKMGGWSAFTKKNKKIKELEEVEGELRGAVKAHGKQADIVKDHIDDLKAVFLKKIGDKVSWQWGGETHYGTYKSEDDDYIYANTVNDKTKRIPKNK